LSWILVPAFDAETGKELLGLKVRNEWPEVPSYLKQMARDTFENWQSEFLQLLWQVVGLAYFLYIGSPSSKENDDRLDHFYLREHGHAQPLDHQR
jgi:hypothetical protein